MALDSRKSVNLNFFVCPIVRIRSRGEEGGGHSQNLVSYTMLKGNDILKAHFAQ